MTYFWSYCFCIIKTFFYCNWYNYAIINFFKLKWNLFDFAIRCTRNWNDAKFKILRRFANTFSFERVIQTSTMRILFNCFLNVINLILADLFRNCAYFDWHFELQNLCCKINKKSLLLFLLLSSFIMSNFFNSAFAKFNFFLQYSVIKLNIINFFSLVNLLCIQFLCRYKIIKIIVIYNHANEMFIILKIISLIFKFQNYCLQFLVIRVLSFFYFFKFIIHKRNEISSIIIVSLIKHIVDVVK